MWLSRRRDDPQWGRRRAPSAASASACLEASVATPDGIERQTFPMDGIGRNAAFLDLLQAEKIVSMHTLEASLDDVFIKATGAAKGAA